MGDLKRHIESVRNYAYKRLEEGKFDVITVYYDENIECVRVVVEIDTYRLDLVVLPKRRYMYQMTTSAESDDVILFNNITKIPGSLKDLVEEKLEEFNSKQKELEIKRLEKKLKELKNQ